MLPPQEYKSKAKLPILIAPDPRLKVIANPVAKEDGEIRKLMDDMLETMYAAPGIGLAAPQVGVPKRVLVIDLSAADSTPEPLQIVNPEFVWTSDEQKSTEEGCLSLPNQFAEVRRPARACVRYIDHTGVTQAVSYTHLTLPTSDLV